MNRSRVEWATALGTLIMLTASCGGSAESGATSGTGGGATAGPGATGTGGTGGSGGAAPSPCLAPSTHAALFTIEDKGFCAVAIHEADAALGFLVPAWGKHGGPLVMEPDAAGGGVTLTRWTAAPSPMSKLSKQETHVDAMIPAGAYAGAQAVDLPFFDWTAISWTGAFPDTLGKIVMLKGTAVDKSYVVNGAYAIGGFAASPTDGRLLYTGLSALGSPTASNNALYAADTCPSPSVDLGCAPATEIAAWGDASGPVAVDRQGNAFVVMPSFATSDQEARGFAAASIAKGKGPTAGDPLFKLPGFGTSLAVLTPSATHDGLVAFQAFDAATSKAADVIAQGYKAGATITGTGMPTKLLALAAGSPGVSLLVDEQERLWVGVSGTTTTTYVVLDRVF